MKKALLILSLWITSLSFSQIQIAYDIDPLTPFGYFGTSLNTISNGITVHFEGPINCGFSDHLDVWTQIGTDILGKNLYR